MALPGNYWSRDVPRTSHPLRHPLRGQPVGEGYVQAHEGPHGGAQESLVRDSIGSTDFSITYKQGSFRLSAFSDANWGSNPNNGRSTSSYIVMLANAPISFKVGLQRLTTQSTVEAVLVSAALIIKEAVFCSNMMLKPGFDESFGSVPLYIDHTLTLRIAGNCITVLAKNTSR